MHESSQRAKYVDSLPLYRQEAMFERHGVRLPRATQAAWMIGLTLPLQPLMNLMDERLRTSGYVRIDETRIQVLNSDKAPSALHWMWVRVAGPKHQRIILFDYDASRGGEVADVFGFGVYCAYRYLAHSFHAETWLKLGDRLEPKVRRPLFRRMPPELTCKALGNFSSFNGVASRSELVRRVVRGCSPITG